MRPHVQLVRETSGKRMQAEETEELRLREHRRQVAPLDAGAVLELEVPTSHSGEALEELALLSEFLQHLERKESVPVLLDKVRHDVDQPISPGKRQRLPEQAVHHREYARARGDGEPEQSHRGQRKSRRARQTAQHIERIVRQASHGGAALALAAPRAEAPGRRPGVTESPGPDSPARHSSTMRPSKS